MKSISLLTLFLAVPAELLLAQSAPTYLALGDSVPYGMNVSLLPPYSTQPPTSAEFVGFPETVAAADHITEMNAACPGETSGSFLDTGTLDNGCNSPHIVVDATGNNPVVIPSFKSIVPSPLHTPYSGSQMAFAMSQLHNNKNIKLVTLNIGANDVLLVLPQLEQCGSDPMCAGSVLGPVLASYGNNLAAILSSIRAEYQGTLILMTYYSPLPPLNSLTQAVNGVMTSVAAAFPDITIVDGYTAFQLASASSNGDACQAGLLVQLPASPYDMSPCDIHPSPSGRNVLASLIECYAQGPQPNVSIAEGQTCTFIGNKLTGNVTLDGGSLSATNSVFTGNLQVSSGAFSINSSVVTGNLQVQNVPAGAGASQVCGTSVGGNLQIHNSGPAITVGNPAACAGNTVSGNLQAQNGSGALEISGNSVKGNLQVMNNTGATQVVGNSVKNKLQCENNTQLTLAGPNTAGQKQGQCY